MSKTERIIKLACALGAWGLNPAEIGTLMRAERRLHRWHEVHCNGDVWEQDAGGWVGRHGRPVRDAGASAGRQVERVMDAHPELVAYVQTDPRGCALYVLRRADVAGEDVASVYSRGVAVCV